MRRELFFVCSLGVMLCGCKGESSRPADSAMFRAVSMRIHPIFTRVRDWTTDQRPDGIDALIEFQDQFGDPCKASGTVIFELFEFQKYDPERRGPRVCNPWVGSLKSLADQRERWNRTSRTYSFPLEYDQISSRRSYVLTAQFQLEDDLGGRFFDQIVLEPPQGAYGGAGSKPGTAPTTLPTSLPTTRPDGGPGTLPAPLPGLLPPRPGTEPANEPANRTPSP